LQSIAWKVSAKAKWYNSSAGNNEEQINRKL
jgi:hypothetical protein